MMSIWSLGVRDFQRIIKQRTVLVVFHDHQVVKVVMLQHASWGQQENNYKFTNSHWLHQAIALTLSRQTTVTVWLVAQVWQGMVFQFTHTRTTGENQCGKVVRQITAMHMQVKVKIIIIMVIHLVKNVCTNPLSTPVRIIHQKLAWVPMDTQSMEDTLTL